MSVNQLLHQPLEVGNHHSHFTDWGSSMDQWPTQLGADRDPSIGFYSDQYQMNEKEQKGTERWANEG